MQTRSIINFSINIRWFYLHRNNSYFGFTEGRLKALSNTKKILDTS